VSGLTQNRER